MLTKTKTSIALRFMKRLVPAFYWAVIDEAIAAIEWRKANDSDYVEREHDA